MKAEHPGEGLQNPPAATEGPDAEARVVAGGAAAAAAPEGAPPAHGRPAEGAAGPSAVAG